MKRHHSSRVIPRIVGQVVLELVGLLAIALAPMGLAAINPSDEITLAPSPTLEQFFGLERNEDGGYLPKWLLAVEHNGEWQTDPPPLAFHVSASQEENTGVLRLQINRSALAGEGLVLALTYDAGDQEEKGSLYIGLSSWAEGVEPSEEGAIFNDLFGNIMQGLPRAARGQGETVTEYFEIPIQSIAAQSLSLDIYRGTGEINIFGAVLWTKSEFSAWLEQALVQGAASDVASAGQESEDLVGADLAGGTSLTPKPSAVGRPADQPAAPVVLPAAQIATAVQLASDYMIITRSVLSGGGARQNSPNFILENSFAQSSAIGFSYGNGVILHAGFQQDDDQQLEIWNATAIPSVFNSALGELTTLSYVLSTRSPRVSIEVTDNITTAVLVAGESQAPGLHTKVWDGKDTNGNYVTPGDWWFRIRAADYQSQVTTNEDAQVRIWNVIPVILSVSDAPDPFCPATDGTTTISYTTTNQPRNRSLDVTISIEDAYGNLITSFSTNNQLPGSYSINWDGTGAPRNGLYIYRINAINTDNPRRSANEKTGTIILACNPECVTSSDGNLTVCYQPNGFSIAITPATPDQVSDASRALLPVAPGLLFASRIYDIEATPPTNFVPPAILTFSYDPAIIGDIGGKLELRQYDGTNWVAVSAQFVDYLNNRIIAEATSFSIFALFAVSKPVVPAVLPATVRLEPEALNVNPGILTAFVSLPEGYPASGITSATCDGALYERMMLNDDATEMIIKFRRQAIEAALAEIGETIDIYFVVRGIWQDAAGVSHIFEGADSITKIIGGN